MKELVSVSDLVEFPDSRIMGYRLSVTDIPQEGKPFTSDFLIATFSTLEWAETFLKVLEDDEDVSGWWHDSTGLLRDSEGNSKGAKLLSMLD